MLLIILYHKLARRFGHIRTRSSGHSSTGIRCRSAFLRHSSRGCSSNRFKMVQVPFEGGIIVVVASVGRPSTLLAERQSPDGAFCAGCSAGKLAPLYRPPSSCPSAAGLQYQYCSSGSSSTNTVAVRAAAAAASKTGVQPCVP